MSAERLATREFFDWQVATGARPEAQRQHRFGDVASELEGERFRVQGSLGSGGMGVVLDAWDEQVRRRVAIKVSTRALTAARMTRFAREGELAAALNHPGIVRVHGGGVTPAGYPFLIMERVEGARPLDEVLQEVGLEAGVALLEEVARTVGAAHRAGVVHRDLKFDNVLVDAQGRTKVCDFGLALREGDDRLTQSGAAVGTPLFMPPEQAGFLPGTRPGPPADVWALGVMLFRHVAGQFPFQGETFMAFTAALTGKTPLLPASAPAGLRAVCKQALAFEPAERYADGEAFATALAAARSSSGRAARRTGWALALVGVVALGAALAFASSKRSRSVPADRAPEAGAQAQARDEALEEATVQAVTAAIEAGDVAGAERHLQRLTEGDSRQKLELALTGAKALSDAKALHPAEALRRLGVASEWLSTADPDDVTRTLDRLEELVALLGDACLPQEAGELYDRGVEEVSFGNHTLDARSWIYLLRMARTGPRRLESSVGLVIHQRLEDAWKSERLADCVEPLEILARCGEPSLLRIPDRFEGQDKRLHLHDELSRRADTNWSIRFLRGLFMADLLTMNRKFAKRHESRDELIEQAAQDLAQTGSKPRNPFVDAQVPIWTIMTEGVKRPDSERVLRDLRGLIERGHPDEYLLRMLMIHELRLAGRKADVLAELPLARAALAARAKDLERRTVPPGGSTPTSAWETRLEKNARWAAR
jgi:hypothetical protein